MFGFHGKNAIFGYIVKTIQIRSLSLNIIDNGGRGEIETNRIFNENCLSTMNRMSDNYIDLVVTSPPY